MKKLLRLRLFALLFLCSPMLHAQFQNGLWTGKEAYNWFFGEYAALNFETAPPIAITGSQMVSQEGTGTISDSEGNLLFYTDGITVWNKNHEIMENGEGLAGAIFIDNGPFTPPSPFNTTTQNGLIIPVPGNPDLYYIFCQVAENGNGLTYSEVDMSLDNGLGGITSTKNVQLSAFAGETMTAVHHTDGESIWFITQTGNYFNEQNEFQAYLISTEGINATPVVSVAGVAEHGGIVVQMKASPDGTKLALTESIYAFIFDLPAQCQVFDFDTSTGMVSNAVDLTDINVSPSYDTGVEFSPNNRFLYVAGSPIAEWTTNLYQVDLLAGDAAAIVASAVIVNPGGNDSMMQVGPDGKIYVMQGDVQEFPSYSVINYPNNKGLACGYGSGTVDGVDLGQRFALGSMPSFIQSYFESGILYEGGGCPGEEIAFSTIRIPGITNIAWDFGDTVSGASNTATDLEPTHKFSAGGTYTVTAVITSNGAEQVTTTQVIVLPAPDIAVPALENLAKCADADGTAQFDLTQLDATILTGQDAEQFSVTYYGSESDMYENHPIQMPEVFVTEGQMVIAVVANNENGCRTSIAFTLTVEDLPLLPDASEFIGCNPFNLEDISAMSQGLNLSYHVTEADAWAGTNMILNTDNYSFFGNDETIFIRSQNAAGCINVGALHLLIGNCEIPKGISPNNDGKNDAFDLSGFEVIKLEIFNRYGQQEYSRNDYTDQWYGQADNGNELPTGTYYYVVQLKDGESKTGWVYVNRQEN
jgi:gliding motility-associated-like protein